MLGFFLLKWLCDDTTETFREVQKFFGSSTADEDDPPATKVKYPDLFATHGLVCWSLLGADGRVHSLVAQLPSCVPRLVRSFGPERGLKNIQWLDLTS